MFATIAIIALVVVCLAIIFSVPFFPEINTWMDNRMYARNLRRDRR
jgi:hypothetical protein